MLRGLMWGLCTELFYRRLPGGRPEDAVRFAFTCVLRGRDTHWKVMEH